MDWINGLFELGGSILCWLNVVNLCKDKEVKGVYWPATAFFAAFGIWNLFYYPSLNQWASFAGGVSLVLANVTWVVLALRWKK